MFTTLPREEALHASRLFFYFYYQVYFNIMLIRNMFACAASTYLNRKEDEHNQHLSSVEPTKYNKTVSHLVCLLGN